MADQRSDSLFRRGWRNVREAGPRRLALTVLMLVAALLVARFSWYLPGLGDAERNLFDWRSVAEADRNDVPQDERVVMVVYDDQTLIAARKRSPLDRGILARALKTIDTMNPKAIGIDIALDQPQDEDAQLIATLRAMETPTFIAYLNTQSTAENIQYEQEQYLQSFAQALEGSKAAPASVRLNNAEGVVRLWPDLIDGEPPLLSRAMLSAGGDGARTLPGYEGAVRYQLPKFEGETVFSTLQIDNFADPERLVIPGFTEAFRSQIEGKYVLIGADIIDIDRLPTPLSEAMGTPEPPGVMFYAASIAQMLDGAALAKPVPLSFWLLALLFVAMAALSGLLEWGNWQIYLLLGVQFLVMLGIPFLLHMQGVDSYGLPAVGWVAGWIIAFTAVTSAARAAGAVQRNFAQGALGKYLPREMAREIIDKPELLALHGEKKEIYVLFSDLEGFTKMSHALPPEMVATLLNRYLEMLSQVVLDHGGVIDKFVGDAVVAFWGAPIARADDGTRAAQAGYAIWQAGEAFRKEVAQMDPALPPIGKTRVGLHFGEAVVGNFGGDTRIQYTALGDSMNTAARLEAANKALDSSVMASREFAQRSGLDWWREMGRVVLRGRARPVDIMEPAPDFPAEDRDRLRDAVILSENDNTCAINMVEQLVRSHPDDTALRNLLHRMKSVKEGNAYVLG